MNHNQWIGQSIDDAPWVGQSATINLHSHPHFVDCVGRISSVIRHSGGIRSQSPRTDSRLKSAAEVSDCNLSFHNRFIRRLCRMPQQRYRRLILLHCRFNGGEPISQSTGGITGIHWPCQGKSECNPRWRHRMSISAHTTH